MGHLAKDYRVEKKVEETTNLALEVEANEGFLLMTQKEVYAKMTLCGISTQGKVIICEVTNACLKKCKRLKMVMCLSEMH